MLTFDSLLFRSLATLALLIAIVAALYFARPAFLPIALGLLTALVLHLPSNALARLGIPRTIATGLLLAVVAALLVLVLVLMAGPVNRIVDAYPEIITELRAKLFHLRQTFAAAEQAGDAISRVAEDMQGMANDPGVQEVIVREPGFLTRAAISFADAVTGIVATLTIAAFVLAIRRPFLTLATMPFASRASKLNAARIWKCIESEVSHYFLVTTLINAALGTAVGLVLWASGVPLPHAWGIGAALLNYVLFVGPAIGILSLLAASIIQFDTLFQVLVPPAAYLTINFIEANVVTPHFLGRRLNIAPLAILLSLLFWGWLWGIAGLIVALPFLVVLKSIADRVPALEGVRRIITPRRPAGTAMEPARPAGVVTPERRSS
ncbi:AI-2E family transporter [Oricola thermophila]|uniref:AI-2E family transporter n=1 Tax=Oricola thermophila TaxID=2742145 RepID=A0A6N1VDV6_9HYPH|nr:AI-2E family transporter [Oricola thermophila]QKV19034.1 AI-2E family transporter [Oricola thermophila]